MADGQGELGRISLKRGDLFREQCYIDGKWTGDPTVEVRNPATRGVVGRIPNLGKSETERAVAAAHAALPKWRGLTAKDRAVIMRKWNDLMVKHQEDLARLMTAEQGKPLAEARGEVIYAGSFFEWFGEEAKRAYGDVIPGPATDRRIMVIKQPVGVVGAITPWNFPAAMITRKVGPAIAAGCTVVLKPSELTPYSAFAIALLGEEAGLPPGVLNIVTGDAEPIGRVLTEDPRIAKFTFTGSTPVGKKLAAQCTSTVKRVSLELGGNAPFLVFDDADIDAAVAGAIISKFRNTGQTCVCANRFFVQDGIYEKFAKLLAEKAADLVVGDGLAGVTQQGPLINMKALEKVEAHVAEALGHGAKALTGAAKDKHGGTFYQPTVLRDVAPDALLAREETFGPVAGLIRFKDEADAIRMANDSRAGLAAYAYTSNLSRSWRVAEGLEYGMVGMNTGLISTEVSPFGGVKESGIGREGSHYGIDEFLDVKAITIQL
ncbi:MAG TPA: NAD-dependent succinate-semialdehyde dehydrogenase [Hyphomonadaceae bacterium]|nr:NAD-dependent succinate-semialdehyde dehydrogenase [Hyphomonadaceae bacterium]HPN05454.1 NAD-dependent succinate-semialdehyde dehydrogenase [Hyphomonadaceae bacterium]